jgi:hypothetical protein
VTALMHAERRLCGRVAAFPRKRRARVNRSIDTRTWFLALRSRYVIEEAIYPRCPAS